MAICGLVCVDYLCALIICRCLVVAGELDYVAIAVGLDADNTVGDGNLRCVNVLEGKNVANLKLVVPSRGFLRILGNCLDKYHGTKGNALDFIVGNVGLVALSHRLGDNNAELVSEYLGCSVGILLCKNGKSEGENTDR